MDHTFSLLDSMTSECPLTPPLPGHDPLVPCIRQTESIFYKELSFHLFGIFQTKVEKTKRKSQKRRDERKLIYILKQDLF